MSVIAIVPLKKNSRRLNYKNLLSLDNRPLAYHIFNTLKSIKEIDEIYCYSSSKEFMKFLPDGIGFLKRPKKLDGDNIKANELFMYAAKKLKSEFILLTHATNPFIKKSSIIKGIKAVKFKKYDCSFAVLKHQKYGWYKKTF